MVERWCLLTTARSRARLGGVRTFQREVRLGQADGVAHPGAGHPAAGEVAHDQVPRVRFLCDAHAPNAQNAHPNT